MNTSVSENNPSVHSSAPCSSGTQGNTSLQGKKLVAVDASKLLELIGKIECLEKRLERLDSSDEP